MRESILDRPVWSALTTLHDRHAIGTENARRFQPDIGPLGAARDESAASLAELGALVATTGRLIVAQASEIVCPPATRVAVTIPAVQMVFDGPVPSPEGPFSIGRLGEADAQEMVALALLTNPGPFASRTYVLGEYWGIRQEGRLVAMAGERFKQPCFTEISGVCTHPDHVRRGYARELCRMLADRITGRGEQAYLHVFRSNTGAVALYERLGFRVRRAMTIAVLEPG